MKRFEHWIGIAAGIAGAVMAGAVLGAWQQVLDMLAGRTVYALLGFWAAAGLGVAAGCFAVRGVGRKMRWNVGCAAGAFFALGAWLVVQLALEGMLRGMWRHFQLGAERSFAEYIWMIAKTAGLTVFAPAALAACAVQGGQVGGGRRERAAGWGLALCGYLLAESLCVYRPPEALTRMAALGMAVLAGASVMRGCGKLSAAWVFSAVLPFAVTAGLAVALLPGKWVNPLSADGVFGRLSCRDCGFGVGTPELIYAARGHTIVFYEDADYVRVCALDGRSLMFGNRFAAARTLTGYAPLLVRPKAEKVALVGAECGVYLPFFERAGMTATANLPRRLVEPFVLMDTGEGLEAGDLWGPIPAKPFFFEWRGYDIVFVAPEPGWVRGSGKVYGPGALRRYRDALTEDGIVALRLDGRAMSEARFASIAKDFMAVFPGVQVWCVGASDWMLIGGRKPITADMDGMAGLLAKDAVFSDWVRAGNMGLPEMLACMVCDEKGLGEWLKGRAAGEGARAAEWRGPRRVIEGAGLLAPMLEAVRQQEAEWVLAGGMDEELYNGMMADIEAVRHARGLAVQVLVAAAEGRQEDALAAAKAAAVITSRDALLLQMADLLNLDAQRRVRFGDFKGALACYENLLAFSSEAARYHHGMGCCLRATGDRENAFRHFARAVGAAPEETAYRLDLARAAQNVGVFPEADRQYREVLKREPDNAEAHLLFAKALTAQKRQDKDFDQAVKLAERACELTAWKDRKIAFGLADIYIEAGRPLEGVGLKRKLREQGEKEKF